MENGREGGGRVRKGGGGGGREGSNHKVGRGRREVGREIPSDRKHVYYS